MNATAIAPSSNGQSDTVANRVASILDSQPAAPAPIVKLSRKAFMLAARPLTLSALGLPMAEPKLFATGSVGFYANGKVTIKVGEMLVKCQVGITVTAVKSKEWDDARREAFIVSAKPEAVGDHYYPAPKEFSTGSVGYYGNGKGTFNGTTCQVGITITAIGSKEWAE